MEDKDEEKINSEIDPSEEDVNTDDAEDEAAEDESKGKEGEGDKDEDEDEGKQPEYTEREKQLYARMKKAQGFKLVDGKWVKPPKPAAKPTPAAKTEVDESLVDAKVQAALDKRDLDSLEVSDALKTEIKNYAKLHKVSIKAASDSPYIKFMKGEEEKRIRAEEAATGTKRKTQTKVDFKDASPDQFDLSTEQGRKDWESYKTWLKGQ